MIRIIVALSFIFLLPVGNAFSQDKPALREIDRTRLAEAFRLSDQFGDELWPGWSKAPLAVLLVTPDKEFLIRHPQPSNDFISIGYDSKLKSEVFYRDRKFSTNLLATFPAVGGISTIVIGQAENTASKTSTPWVVTLMHEHFHQLQDAQPNFFKDTEALNLSHGDQTGMWMLNYPFPYEKPVVGQVFPSLVRSLLEAMTTRSRALLAEKMANYLVARHTVKRVLSPDDYKYFAFQTWKEGLARYTEYRVAKWAAAKYRPTRDFRSLKDFTTFRAAADQVYDGIVHELSTLKIEDYKRVAFYPIGAGEGLLLDRSKPRWRNWYFAEKFDNWTYFMHK
jgi:hypothetical protein